MVKLRKHVISAIPKTDRLIELASYLLAVLIGSWIILTSRDWTGAAFAYLLGICIGGLGARLSAIHRERLSEKCSRSFKGRRTA